MDERYCLARKGRNSAFINKLVTEIGHTSERKVGGGPKRTGGLRSWSPPVSHLGWYRRRQGKPNMTIVWPGWVFFSPFS